MPFGNLGFGEILIILIIVLLLFGAKRIPEIAGSMGKGIREFKRNISDAERSLNESARDRPADRLPPPAPNETSTEESKSREPRRLL
jgi:sec-independent protein translocase protein TatA